MPEPLPPTSSPPPLPPPLPTPSRTLPSTAPGRALWRQSLDAHDELEEGETRHRRGIGGWLLLFAIGRVLAVILWALSLSKDLPIFIQPGLWHALTTPGSSAYQPFWSNLILYETIGNALMLLGSIVIVCLLFTQRKFFRPLTMIYLVVTPMFLWGDYALAGPIETLHPGVLDQIFNDCLQNTLVALVWVPYFWVSERVRGTFYK